ncbi:MotA/TolQ/ExbB proton channel family protein [Vibrio sp. LaRot3]|uniref:MotA/TolQ/ExbB proton channel family protein n=1 Tax=Vibrio sp. LaRot3 TaxID=2998829 RepID=UPI0022CDF1CE|nr:MotA/TolQ/ExbB proton channel family protein [Vibrio sp. LaRot3]MDA0149956.1 MotA/TolQ/ExbB proton channel family protein [Vibrio sp. LaRot3]
MKRITVLALTLVSSQFAMANSSMDQVLQQVRQGSVIEKQQAQQSVNHARVELKQVEKNLNQATQKLAATNQANIALEDQILALQEKLKQRRSQYQTQRDAMASVFKHVVEHSDLMLQRTMPHGLWQHDQSGFKTVEEQSVDIAQIKSLWLALTEQIVLSGKVLQSEQTVVLPDGLPQQSNVTQFGPFTAYASTADQRQWLTYLAGEQMWAQMTPQPNRDISSQQSVIDPSFGALLAQEAVAPTWFERLAPAGVVGILIGLVGLTGVVIALGRGLVLRKEKQAIKQQMNQSEARDDNALGRVILATEKSSLEQLDAVIDEAVLKEVPKFKFGVGSLAVFASIPPLLGLLGTVGGMIETFRVITEHGSADSQLLSGGISQALLTTELGLMVAVPLLLLHCGLKAQSNQLIEVLEQQSAGLIVLRQQQAQKDS